MSADRSSEFHVKVNNGKRDDLYARPNKGSLWDPCGCELLPCGFVRPNPECKWHGDAHNNHVKKLYGHFASNCPNPGGHQ